MFSKEYNAMYIYKIILLITIIITDNSLELRCNCCCFVFDNKSTTEIYLTILCGTYKYGIYALKLCVKRKLYLSVCFALVDSRAVKVNGLPLSQ